MIQRIQTLFILLAIAVNIVIFNFDLAAFTYSGNINNFTLLGLIDSNTGTYLYTNWLIAGLAIVTILIGLLAIFLFKKRSFQIKITQLCLFFQTIFVVSIFYFVDQLQVKLMGSEELAADSLDVSYSSGSLLALIPFVFLFLAIRAISKDEKLIKAADRLR